MAALRRGLLVLLFAVSAACGPGEGSGDDDAGARMPTRRPGPTLAECPEGSTLRYEGFGEAFLERYCVRCHASTLTTVGERGGAPLGTDLDTLEGVRMHLEAIDGAAAAGPTRINVFMPPPTSPELPTEAERDQLGAWIACGAP